jgi:hypothetical protein
VIARSGFVFAPLPFDVIPSWLLRQRSGQLLAMLEVGLFLHFGDRAVSLSNVGGAEVSTATS